VLNFFVFRLNPTADHQVSGALEQIPGYALRQVELKWRPKYCRGATCFNLLILVFDQQAGG